VFLGRPANNRLALPGARCLLAEKMVAAMRTDGADDEINPSSTDGSNDENRNQDHSERCVF